MSLYLKGRFYTKLAIKYLMESFYATAIGVKCIMNSPLGDIHKGKILHQPVNICLIKGQWSRDISCVIPMCSLVSLHNDISLTWSRNPALRCMFHMQPEEYDSEQIFAYTFPLICYKYITCFILRVWHTTIIYRARYS